MEQEKLIPLGQKRKRRKRKKTFGEENGRQYLEKEKEGYIYRGKTYFVFLREEDKRRKKEN